MNSKPQKKTSVFRSLFFGLSPWLLLGTAVILGLAITVMAVKNAQREKQSMTQNMMDRAEALIWALEAGTRTWMGMHGSDPRSLQTLVEETAKQPGIIFMAVTDEDGNILADSDPTQVGGRIAQNRLPARDAAGTPDWRMWEWNGKRVFEVFRSFVPVRGGGHGSHWPGRHGGMMGGTGRGGAMMRDDRPTPGSTGMTGGDSGMRSPATDIVFVGLDSRPFEEALAQDFRNSVFSACLVAALGLAGVVSLFWAHNHRRSRRMLRDSQAMAGEVVANLPLGLLTGDPAGKVAMVNATALSLLNLRAKDAAGMPLAQLPGLDWGGLIAALDRKDKIFERDIDLLVSGKKPVSVELGAATMHNDDGVFLGHLFILRETTEMKRLRAEAQRNDRLTALGKLASGVAHEIRNPLSTIKGIATYLAKRSQPGGREEEAAETMVAEVDRLNRVVSELLDFARPAAVTLVEADLREVVDRALRLASADLKAKDITVLVEQDPDFPTVRVSPERLTQALLNLFLNAAQAMETGGELRVGLRPHPEAETFSLVVADTGPGIAEADQAAIFTPYFTTKPSGTGLGLAIVHQIIEGHGGSIRLESAVGAGAEFTITLPLAK